MDTASLTPIQSALLRRGYHWCGQCLAPCSATVFYEDRQGSSTMVVAICVRHRRMQRGYISDSFVEDNAKVWWFIEPTDGEPYINSATRRRQALAAEVERERVRRAREVGNE